MSQRQCYIAKLNLKNLGVKKGLSLLVNNIFFFLNHVIKSIRQLNQPLLRVTVFPLEDLNGFMTSQTDDSYTFLLTSKLGVDSFTIFFPSPQLNIIKNSKPKKDFQAQKIFLLNKLV